MGTHSTFGNTGAPGTNVWSGSNTYNSCHDGGFYGPAAGLGRFYCIYGYVAGHSAAVDITHDAWSSASGFPLYLVSLSENINTSLAWHWKGECTDGSWNRGNTWIGSGDATTFGLGFSRPASGTDYQFNTGNGAGAYWCDTQTGATWEPPNIAGSTQAPMGFNGYIGVYADQWNTDVFVRRSGAWVRCQPYVRRSGAWVKTVSYVRRSGVWTVTNLVTPPDPKWTDADVPWLFRRGRWRPLHELAEHSSEHHEPYRDDMVLGWDRSRLPGYRSKTYEERIQVSSDGGLSFEEGLLRIEPDSITRFGNWDPRPWVMANPDLYFGRKPLYPYDLVRGIGGRGRHEPARSWTPLPKPGTVVVGAGRPHKPYAVRSCGCPHLYDWERKAMAEKADLVAAGVR
jgi:hypothetical protein